MPEAPEVASILSTLEEQIKDVPIEKVVITHPKLIENMPVEQFCQKLVHQAVRSFGRHGKYLILETDDYHWIAHMRMEGKFFLYDTLPEEEKIRKHLHALFYLKNGKILAYHDTRKFGRMDLYDRKESLAALPVFAKMGPDVLSEAFTAADLQKKLSKKKCAVKTALLDQKIVAGIGNIYADEILYAAGLHPASICSHLSLHDCEKIVAAAKDILSRAKEAKGTTIRTFSYDGSHTGEFQNQLKVHDREGASCENCGSAIEKVLIAKRSTYLCPVCQEKK